MESSITQPFNTSPKSRLPKLSSTKLPMSYAMALLQLEKKVYSNPKFVEIIEQSQQKSSDSSPSSITITCTPASLPISLKPMSIPPARSIRGSWCVAMLKPLKIRSYQPHPCFTLYWTANGALMASAWRQFMGHDFWQAQAATGYPKSRALTVSGDLNHVVVRAPFSFNSKI